MRDLTLFLFLSIPLIAVSRRVIFNPQKPGLYRLVVWECVLWLAVSNYEHLIVKRFDFQQIASSLFMIASLIMVLSAVHLMRTKGRPAEQRRDSTLFAFEKTTELVESGVFRYVRHPMYGSLLLLAWGLLLRNIEPPLLAVAAISTAAAVVAARIEEKENLAYFGHPYELYMLKTKRFIPYIF